MTGFLVPAHELLESSGSFEQFVDSFDESSDSGGVVGLSRGEGMLTAPPSLESLLTNLNLEKPILSSANNANNAKPPSFDASENSKSCIKTDYSTRRNNSISWLSTAFKWEPTSSDNLIIDAGSTDSKPIILYASKMKLIEKLTTILDYKLMDNLLLTVEMILHPMDFASCLLSRLAQAFHAVPGWNSQEEINPEVVKMRGLILLQHWAGINSQNDDETNLDLDIRKIVVEALDLIWQQSRALSQSDKIFLIKIRRLFDPRGEIATTSQESDLEDDNQLGNDNNNDSSSSSVYDSEPLAEVSMKWRDKLKIRLRSFFTGNDGNRIFFSKRNSNISSPQSSSSLLINSFTSEAECNDDLCTVLMSQRSKNLAVILAVLEWDLFIGIHRSEIVSFPCARDSPHRLAGDCPNLQRSIEHFNSMCQWFVQLISNQNEGDASLLSKLIRLAVKCVLIHNYNSALQIILALQSPAASVRKDLWLSLPTWERRLAKDLAAFGSPVKNFRNVRRALEDVQKEDIPVIPFNGLFLSDLVFNWERSSSSPSPSEELKNQNHQSPNLIPIYKNHLAAKIVRQFLEFQNRRHRFEKELSTKERKLYSYFADIGRLGGEFSM